MLDRMLSLDGTLDAPERKKRFLILMFSIMCSLFPLYFIVAFGGRLAERYIYSAGSYVAIASGTLIVSLILCKRRPPEAFFTTAVFVGAGVVFCWDLDSRTTGTTAWPLQVLMLDMLLVLQVGERYSTALACCTIVWLFVLGVEQSFRFGLFDLPGPTRRVVSMGG